MRYLPLSLAIIAACSQAQEVEQDQTQRDEQQLETVLITASPVSRSALNSATPVTVVSGEQLNESLGVSLGDTLNNTVGVHSTYYGPVAGSPIIRGMDGPRIKVVQNGLDVADVSRVGPDHAVATETATATQIEVLRGPATLLYGSGAIGGVVNVVDNRLPLNNTDGVSGKLLARYKSVAEETNLSAALDGGHGQFAWHLDAFDHHSDDYKIPGHAEILDADEPADHEAEGTLENSAYSSDGFTAGATWIGDDVRFALSYGELNNLYGVPGHHHHEEEHEDEHDEDHEDESHEDEGVNANLEQQRVQAVLDWHNVSDVISAFHWHSAWTDYQHQELEGDAVGTTFSNTNRENRIWVEHSETAGWHGALGVHLKSDEFSALGEEAFTPPTKTEQNALFVVEEKQQGSLTWQLGARIERVSHDIDNGFFPVDEEGHQIAFDKFEDNALSGSAGIVWQHNPQATITANIAYSERVPSAAELFAFGPHIGTASYELGGSFAFHEEAEHFHVEQSSQLLDKEVSTNFDLGYRLNGDHWHLTYNLFYNQVDNYIFQQDTGLHYANGEFYSEEEHDDHDEDHADHEGELGETATDEHDHEEEMPVYQFAQQDATLMGFEAQLDYHFNDNWRIDSFTDYTYARLDDDSYVPRIPPWRVGSHVHFENDAWHAEFGAVHYFKQSKTAEHETSTAGYTLVDASINYYLPSSYWDMTVFIKGENLLDEEARVHSSFLKDVAPLPGRNLSAGISVRF